MGPHSPADPGDDARRILEGQIRECYGRVVYSHKTHEKCADILSGRLHVIKMTQIVLSVLTTGGFLGVIVGAGGSSAIAGAAFSAALLGLNAYTKDYDLGALAQQHRRAAADLWLIRERYLSLLVDIAAAERPFEALAEDRDELLEQLHSVYGGAPGTWFAAYKKAQEALQKLEDMTFSDAEVDAFLPRELKRVSDQAGLRPNQGDV